MVNHAVGHPTEMRGRLRMLFRRRPIDYRFRSIKKARSRVALFVMNERVDAAEMAASKSTSI